MLVTQQNIELTTALKLHKYQLNCFSNVTHILHDVQLERNYQCKDVSTPRVTSCEGQRKDVIRSSLNFDFEGGTHLSSK
jgi:hypothetical protein